MDGWRIDHGWWLDGWRMGTVFRVFRYLRLNRHRWNYISVGSFEFQQTGCKHIGTLLPFGTERKTDQQPETQEERSTSPYPCPMWTPRKPRPSERSCVSYFQKYLQLSIKTGSYFLLSLIKLAAPFLASSSFPPVSPFYASFPPVSPFSPSFHPVGCYCLVITFLDSYLAFFPSCIHSSFFLSFIH